jgi:hypothetical protein
MQHASGRVIVELKVVGNKSDVSHQSLLKVLLGNGWKRTGAAAGGQMETTLFNADDCLFLFIALWTDGWLDDGMQM